MAEKLSAEEIKANYQKYQVAAHRSYDKNALKKELDEKGVEAARVLGEKLIELGRLDSVVVNIILRGGNYRGL